MSKLRFRQFWVIIFLTAILAALQSYKIHSEEANPKNLNTPFFGQDPAALGQKYTQQQAEDQKTIDAMSKTKSKDKKTGGQGSQQNPQNRDNGAPAGNAMPSDSYAPTEQPMTPGANAPQPSDQPKSGSTPPGELIRGY